ncbi:uncharacterized protein LOC121375954 [Gigantopelta aegis]|uniref:uncharacterized protein LOC121375954 n=1 Tax=Gigantopelta aegis TaxID=1735272 RepID=UPI001B88A4F1|nr:uncharacterized protein LOC121375954 [Gigantopelta aegis]
MAASMLSVLKQSHFCQPTCTWLNLVRWKKKPPKFADPKDTSWAQPLLDWKRRQSEFSAEEPSMIHMVRRIKTLVGRPYWEKETMKALRLDTKINEVVVHKNTPEVNTLLKSVKHLIQITRVKFPYGLPETEDDLRNCVLQDDGQLVVTKTVHPVSVVEEDTTPPTWEMNSGTLKKHNQNKLDNFALNAEYFPAKPTYKYNQDGKEYRYFGNQNVGKNKVPF